MTKTKTKISLTSDRHHELGWDYLNRDTVPKDADIYILAGDIDIGANAITWAASLGERVLYVPGNHEFYNGNLEKVGYELKKKASHYSNLHVLQNECVSIGDIRFLGTTLWTDYAIYNNPDLAMSFADRNLADHRLITTGLGKNCHFFSAEFARQQHFRARKWLETELRKPWEGKTVVVTHHAPHGLSINQRFSRDPLSPAFASDLISLISNFQIDLWLHGHMHDPVNYILCGTRVVCNPRGYEGTLETNQFNPNLILTL